MEEGIVALILAPLIIFLIFVAPIWLILHYRSKKQMSQGLTHEEQVALRELAGKAEMMSERIQTLEAILDNESPEWRNKV
jgi:phage shock protein B